MRTTQLEICVKKEFDMSLCEFVRHKVEAESLHDYELAAILNVDGAFVGKLRKAFGIKKADGFVRRFENTYGKGAIRTFKKIIENPGNGLGDVASYFVFSKEYARQVYKKIYGRPYGELFRKKMLARKRNKVEAKMKSKGFATLMDVTEKMKSLGFVPHMTSKGSAFTLFANGYKLALRSTSKPIWVGGRRYFRISHGNRFSGNCDFFICLCRNNGNVIHYVIPRYAMPRSGVCLSLQAGPLESKYAKFKEAWHLLASEKERREKL